MGQVFARYVCLLLAMVAIWILHTSLLTHACAYRSLQIMLAGGLVATSKSSSGPAVEFINYHY